jgi:phenylalanyl-tRNA synthetase beta chain
MRSSIVGSLLNNLQTNVSRGATRVRIFEIGRVFKRDLTIVDSETETAGFLQDLRLGGLAYGQVVSDQWAQTNRWTDFFDVKGDLERIIAPLQLTTSRCSDHPAMHPGRGAVLSVASVNGTCQEVGFVGELHPRLLQNLGLPRAPIVFELSWSLIEQLELPKLSEISKYPLVERDIAIVVNASIPAQDILNALRLASPSLVKRIHLFDEFKPTVERPSGMALEEKSLAFRLVFEDLQQTLQDQQVESTISSILEQVLVQFSARLR